MRWDPGHQSKDVEDRRGAGGGGGSPLGGAGLGILLNLVLRTKYGWVIALVALIGYVGYRSLLGGGGGVSLQNTQTGRPAALAPTDTDAHFVAFVLDDAQQFWETDFQSWGSTYRRAKLTLFTDTTSTGCGVGEAATGPFYCPGDERVYIDLGFFQVMSQQLGASGEFARAYVIAHEIGHHVQKVLGLKLGGGKGALGNSVRTELQADCYAGIWAHSADARNLLEKGDLDSALNAASRIGDDTLQKEQAGRVRPESFTHGTSDQRKRWLQRGYTTGAIDQCDTFKAEPL